jgi:cell division protein ZapA (FtsZ GTPase activity inhibitor)
MGRNRTTVRIGGQEYAVSGEEPPEYLHRLAAHVDRIVAAEMEANERLGLTAATALAAMKIADELYRAQANNRMLKETIERMAKDGNADRE